MTTALDKAFFAGDAYHHWRRRIASARDSVRLISPTLDSSLADLLSVAPAALNELTVVTSLRPEVVGVGHREHLRGIHHLLENGFEVRATDRPLNANALICDAQLVSAGSQSFTAQARDLDGITIGPGNSIAGSDFADALAAWVASALPVGESLVDALLNRLNDAMRVLEAATTDLMSEFETALADIHEVHRFRHPCRR